jgi:hypothetical protein
LIIRTVPMSLHDYLSLPPAGGARKGRCGHWRDMVKSADLGLGNGRMTEARVSQLTDSASSLLVLRG